MSILKICSWITNGLADEVVLGAKVRDVNASIIEAVSTFGLHNACSVTLQSRLEKCKTHRMLREGLTRERRTVRNSVSYWKARQTDRLLIQRSRLTGPTLVGGTTPR